MGPFLIYTNKWQWHGSLSKSNHQWCQQYFQNKIILWLKHMNISKISFIIFSRNLIIGASVVYRVALNQPSGSSIFVNHCTADFRLTSDITVTLVLVPVELSTSISDRHTTTYVVNTYITQMRVYVHSKHIKYVLTCKYDWIKSNGVDSLRD